MSAADFKRDAELFAEKIVNISKPFNQTHEI